MLYLPRKSKKSHEFRCCNSNYQIRAWFSLENAPLPPPPPPNKDCGYRQIANQIEENRPEVIIGFGCHLITGGKDARCLVWDVESETKNTFIIHIILQRAVNLVMRGFDEFFDVALV